MIPKVRSLIDMIFASSSELSKKANSTDVYNKTETDEKLESKQDKLTAGTNITISNNTISSAGTTYSTATSSTDGLMSKTDKSKLDGLSNYNDTTIKNEISTLKTSKQDKLIAGTNITISNNTISAKDTTYSTATTSANGLMSKNDKTKLDNIFNSIYPVGSIYMSVNSTNPANLFGGTWQQIKDRFLLSCGDIYENGETGGSASHSHGYRIGYYPFYGTLACKDEQAVVAYDYKTETWKSGAGDGGMPSVSQINNGLQEGTNTRGTPISQYSVYADTTNENSLPPYLAVYMWQRTA